MMRDLLYGIWVLIFGVVKGIVQLVHIFFSSIYQSIEVVKDQLRRDLKEWKERRDEDI